MKMNAFCLYGQNKDILKIYNIFQKIIDTGVITKDNPRMENMITALGKNPDDYPCRSDYFGMCVRDYENEDFTRLYLDTWEFGEPNPAIVDLLIDAAGVRGKVKYAYEVCDDNQETRYYPDESTSFLFVEPSEDELMSSINTYRVEETPVEEVAEGMFSGEFVAGEDDFDAFLKRLA